jgi:hypothetical protein
VKVTWSFEARHAACPDRPSFIGTLSFPRETGGAATDAEIAAMAEGWLAEARARAVADLARAENPCALEDPGLFMEISYELHRPSPGILGVLFTDRGFDGGPRPWLGFTAYTFELATGRILGPGDVFPDGERARAGLWGFVWAETCGRNPPRESLPSFYGGSPCSGEAPPPTPEGFLAGAETLEDMGSLILTESGALLNIDPSSAWTWTEGPFVLEIPEAELVGMGADPALWAAGVRGLDGESPEPPEAPAAVPAGQAGLPDGADGSRPISEPLRGR